MINPNPRLALTDIYHGKVGVPLEWNALRVCVSYCWRSSAWRYLEAMESTDQNLEAVTSYFANLFPESFKV